MGRDKSDEFSGSYDLGFLPESREMFLIARDQVVRAGNVGTFQKYVVIGVVRDLKTPCQSHEMTVVLDELQQLTPKAFANLQLWSGKHRSVLLQDRPRDIPPRRFGHGQQHHGALHSGRLDRSGNQHVRVDDKTEGKHYRFGLCDREALMSRSI
jgi:hypothetical protein